MRSSPFETYTSLSPDNICILSPTQSSGFASVAAFYLIPYMIANYHLVLITYLQHTDVFMPHFRGTEWTWLRGKEKPNHRPADLKKNLSSIINPKLPSHLPYPLLLITQALSAPSIDPSVPS